MHSRLLLSSVVAGCLALAGTAVATPGDTFKVASDRVNLRAGPSDSANVRSQVLRGEEVVIARGDKPVVRLVPVDAPQPKRQFGSLKGRLEVPDSFFDPLPEDELKLWEGG